jgi:hypothetical protein
MDRVDVRVVSAVFEDHGCMNLFETFKNSFKKDVHLNDLEIIQLDGYYVRCASVSQIQSIKLKVMDGIARRSEDRVVYLESATITGKAQFPLPLFGNIEKNTQRIQRGIRMTQFPVCCANARTIHKLQGRSIENLFVSSWDYTDNWIYVALSRVRTLKGLFLRIPLDHGRCRGMSTKVREFMEIMRERYPPEPTWRELRIMDAYNCRV